MCTTWDSTALPNQQRMVQDVVQRTNKYRHGLKPRGSLRERAALAIVVFGAAYLISGSAEWAVALAAVALATPPVTRKR